MNNEKIRYISKIPKDKIAKFCQKNNIRQLSFFGSILRSDFNDKSDTYSFNLWERGICPDRAGQGWLKSRFFKKKEPRPASRSA